jgi:hypothetical protein
MVRLVLLHIGGSIDFECHAVEKGAVAVVDVKMPLIIPREGVPNDRSTHAPVPGRPDYCITEILIEILWCVFIMRTAVISGEVIKQPVFAYRLA